uniref:Uncharacterized protein n=1 Tax=Parascaris univalens TaxID=6257 RepID=A0A914ZX07_PARUN
TDRVCTYRPRLYEKGIRRERFQLRGKQIIAPQIAENCDEVPHDLFMHMINRFRVTSANPILDGARTIAVVFTLHENFKFFHQNPWSQLFEGSPLISFSTRLFHFLFKNSI